MAKKTPKILLKKTIAQFRYAPTLDYLAGLIPTAKQFTEFPDWDATGVSINFKDPKNQCSLAIVAQAYTYDQDSDDGKLEEARLSAAVERLPSGLGIQAYTRMGYRQIYLVPLDMPIETLVKLLSVKLFASNNELRQILPPRLDDLLYRLDMGEERYKYHLSLGPVKKGEVARLIQLGPHFAAQPEAARKVIADYPDVAVLIDIDYYADAAPFKIDEAAPFCAGARIKTSNLARRFANYLVDEAPVE